MICMISRIVRLNTEEAYSNIVLDILSINGYEVSIFVASCVLSSTKFIWSSALHSWMHWPMFTTILESLLCHRHLHFRQLPAGILNTCFYVPLSSSLLVMVLLRFFMAIILPQNVIVAIACNSCTWHLCFSWILVVDFNHLGVFQVPVTTNAEGLRFVKVKIGIRSDTSGWRQV